MQSSKIGKYEIWYDSAEEFYELKKEIFSENCYYTELESFGDAQDKPLIVDAGAHIGMATIYFKNLYPNARIIAIEPLPENLKLLGKNIKENQLDKIEILEAALAPKSGEIVIQEPVGEGAWKSGAGIIPKGWKGIQTTAEIRVRAIGVAELLNQSIDLLKMDIEGMEYEVIRAAGSAIRSIRQMIIEVHPRKKHRTEEIEKYLTQYGYSLEIEPDKSSLGKGLVRIRAVLK